VTSPTSALRWFPVPEGYAVAEEPAPPSMRQAANWVFWVRHERTATLNTVLQHPPTPGRWVGHAEPWYSCTCGLHYCAHQRAVLAYLGGPTDPDPKAMAA